jgi:GT2 family glycosyltransferase
VDLTIVVVSYNVRELLRACLGAAARSAAPYAAELIVVDNASRDGSADMVAHAFPHVVLLRNAVNRGFAAACNQGLARGQGRYGLLLNPDAEPLDDALAALVRFADAHPEVGVVGPQLRNADGSLQPSGWPVPRLSALLARAVLGQRAVVPPPQRDFDAVADVGEVSGACLLVRGEVLARVGRLDERFFLGYEDVDLCMRAARAGWRVVYYPCARVRHHHGASGGRHDRALIPRWESGQRHFVRKHYGAAAAAALGAIQGGRRAVRLVLGRAS